MAGHGDVMVALAKQMLGSWRGGETRDLHREMMQLTLEIAAKTLFDADVAGEADEMGRAIGDLMKTFEGWLSGVLPPLVWLPTPGNLRLRRMVQRLDAIIYRIIEERKATAEDRGDLLSMLLAARDEDGRRMTDQQVRDEAMTLLLAGQETTAQMLSWTWYLLSQHAEVEAKLFAEWSSVLEGRAPTMADLPRLAYTEKVVSESLRLYPPAYRFGREALGDCELGGYRVPAGTTVLFSQWLLHRDARYYDCPEKFNPDRWATGLRQKLPKFSYCPFGGGPRGCIGQSFAMMEAVLLLATIGQRFRFRLAPGQRVTAWPSFTLRPKEGIRMVLTERRGGARGWTPVGSRQEAVGSARGRVLSAK
jgi:cytochrome P450